jgi:tRNA-2-methylthio-N6-dimethylallyladenosine synthase
MNTYYIETFGCQMNELDSEKIAGLLQRRGLISSPKITDADLILFNTCSVREKAAQKVLSRLGTLKELKRRKPGIVVAVLGCVAQQEGERLVKMAPVVDIVTGPQKLYRIPAMIDLFRNQGGPLVDVDTEKGPSPREIDAVLRESPFRAKVTIQEGCDKFCTFCIVPYARGREKNRPSQAILNEVRALADNGYIEILLLGQNVSSYKDPSPDNLSFATLLSAVGSVPGIRRVRFTSPHPSDFTTDVLEVMCEIPAICNQIHMPLQSGSSSVLKRMRRGYTRERYLQQIEVIRKASTKIEISTDIIVGYPAESNEEYNDTLSILRLVNYNQVFSFCYSERPDTVASRYADDVPIEEKKRRLELLQREQHDIQLSNNSRYLGKILEVLVEGNSKTRGLMTGRTTENVCVNFPGSTDLIGRFQDIEIQEVHAHSLKGLAHSRV